MIEGKIVKVSGPLVIAEGLTGAKMYDMVRVGKEKLMGEIIEIRGKYASIQVYEETAGLGPEDPVISTDEPLSVELGPGLVSSIYDGVQRPLDIVREKYGNFVARGVEEPGIARDKKWKFEPKVRVGDEVVEGDILGIVQETTIIEHRVMVPPGVRGKVKRIEKGTFTVKETVAVIETGTGDKEISMLTRWPVRKARPHKGKLTPEEPLVVGQRVIDTFFPVAKGGTACVPGPFGSGKCITGDTPVLMGDGEVVPIKQIFEFYENKGKKVTNKDEQYTVLSKPFDVFAYDRGKILKGKVTAVYKGKTNKVLEIRTRTGRIGRVTPIHKLFKIEDDLSVSQVQARYLRKGDYLATPRFLDFPGSSQTIPVLEIFRKCRVADKTVLRDIPRMIDELAKRFGSKREVALKLNVSYQALAEYYSGRNKPTVGFVEVLYREAAREIPKIRAVKGERQSKIINVPAQFRAKFAAFLGLLLGDGQLKMNSIRFYNNDEQMLDLFEDLAQRLFGLSAKRTIVGAVKCSFIESSILAKLLKYFGYPEYKKSCNCFVPKVILKSPGDVLEAFVSAYFACDGYFDSEKGEVEISTASKKFQTGLSYLLLRLGILNRLSLKVTNGFKQYKLFVSGRSEIEKFYDHCPLFLKSNSKIRKVEAYLQKSGRSYTSLDVVPLGAQHLQNVYTKAGRPYSKLEANGVEVHNYLAGELMNKDMYTKFARAIGKNEPSLSKFATNHLEHIYCDKIVEVREIDDSVEVYDLEVSNTHNFIGGTAPMIYHNTVIQHEISKWANAEIVVFIGCGERGNEMTDVLQEFPKLIDPYTGEPLMKRTVLIANTSNMPVAAREASIYTGITIAEYFRDMGYNVALQADSTSRWAEALREISGRLEEMPGEEGYPAYLGSRLASFYERAGRISCLGSDSRKGSITVIGSVSPPGGDLSEPVVQNTLRVVKVFWGLEDRLAYERHFPAINWLVSYSLYLDTVEKYWSKEVDPSYRELHDEAMKILQRESELKEIVRLVGVEALSTHERLIMETAKSIREDFLQQNAFHEVDTYTSLKKQFLMLRLVMAFHKLALEAVDRGENIEKIITFPIREEIARAKFIPEDKLDQIEEIEKRLIYQLKSLHKSRSD